MNVKPSILIMISGVIWLAVGIFLMQLGVGYLLEGQTIAKVDGTGTPALTFLDPYVGGVEMAALLLVAVALYVGYVKGRFVLGKAARRGVDRILALPHPISLAKIYAPRYYLLLGAMILLGMSLKWFAIPKDIRGIVDIAIGAALINGSMVYFRLMKTAKA